MHEHTITAAAAAALVAFTAGYWAGFRNGCEEIIVELRTTRSPAWDSYGRYK